VCEVEKGLHDGDLGGGLVKKCLARAGEGKRGGYRTIIVYHKGRRAVFLYGFASYLNVTTGLVSKWERGEKQPQGPSLKLLALVQKKGLEAIA
jgi:hypothetical protein